MAWTMEALAPCGPGWKLVDTFLLLGVIGNGVSFSECRIFFYVDYDRFIGAGYKYCKMQFNRTWYLVLVTIMFVCFFFFFSLCDLQDICGKKIVCWS